MVNNAKFKSAVTTSHLENPGPDHLWHFGQLQSLHRVDCRGRRELHNHEHLLHKLGVVLAVALSLTQGATQLGGSA